MNEYTAIVDYYDLLMTSGYYQYEKIAKAISSIISTNHKIIEIGVGSGLLLEQLLKINPQYNFTGIDHTPKMIEMAQKRLGSSVSLFEADIISMSIFEEFDVAISNGGLCAFVETNNGHDLYTHLTDDSNNLQALQNIAHCLHQGGLFIINIQGIHDSYDKHLPGKIVYSQKVVESTANKDCVEKSFYFKKDGHILAQQKLIYKIFKEDAVKDLFSKAGFKFEGIDASEQLFIYSKN